MSDERFASAGKPLRGALTAPPDKSISHRAAILAAMSEGETRIAGYLDAADTRSTLAAVEALGARVAKHDGDAPGGIDVTVEGIGLDGPASHRGNGSALAIDVGNAGTLMRLLPGWLASQEGANFVLDGDESIRRRPVDRVADPLRMMGARLECRDERLPPLEITGRKLIGIDYALPVASAQVKSCLLLAGLRAAGEMIVSEPAPSRDHTERMLRAAGVRLRVETAGTDITVRGELPGKRITLRPVEKPLALGDLAVPGDFSSAAFHLVAALIVPGSRVVVENVGINPTRVGLLGILNRMGAAIEVVEATPVAGELRGTLTAFHGPLQATRVGAGEVPLAIDELPLVALAAAFAEGETVVTGAEELRHKESDRIASVVEAINALGGSAEAQEDGFTVRGSGGLQGGRVDSRGDHRLAMIGAIAGLASREGSEVDMSAAAISYPSFTADLERLAGGERF